MASDSRLTIEDHIFSDKCKKIFRLKDGSLFGWSGDNEGGMLLLRALQDGKKFTLPESINDLAGIRILPKGQIYWTEGYLWQRWGEPFFAIGTGGKYARAAMMAGANAVTAVKVGIASDAHSGGRVQTLRLRR